MRPLKIVLEGRLGNILKNTGHGIRPKQLLRPGMCLDVGDGNCAYVMDKRKFLPLMKKWERDIGSTPTLINDRYKKETKDYVIVNVWKQQYVDDGGDYFTFTIWPSSNYDEDLYLTPIKGLFTVNSIYEYEFTYHETIEDLVKCQDDGTYKKNRLLWQRP